MSQSLQTPPWSGSATSAIDPEVEHPYPFVEIGKLLPKKPSYFTIRRWFRDGMKGRSGRIVRLEAITISGVWHTTVEAYYRMLREVNRGA